MKMISYIYKKIIINYLYIHLDYYKLIFKKKNLIISKLSQIKTINKVIYSQKR